MGRGELQNRRGGGGGHVKFYPYKKGGEKSVELVLHGSLKF